MAQVNICHFKPITAGKSHDFAELLRNVVAWEVHGIRKSKIEPDTVSVVVIPVDRGASLSGADTEIQVLVSGNDWPKTNDGKPADASAAKIHFDIMAAKVHKALMLAQNRKIYVWVTPFTATGWAE